MKKNIIIGVLSCLVLVFGFLYFQEVNQPEKEEVKAKTELRIYANKIQTFDGIKWIDYGEVETLQASDPLRDGVLEEEKPIMVVARSEGVETIVIKKPVQQTTTSNTANSWENSSWDNSSWDNSGTQNWSGGGSSGGDSGSGSSGGGGETGGGSAPSQPSGPSEGEDINVSDPEYSLDVE